MVAKNKSRSYKKKAKPQSSGLKRQRSFSVASSHTVVTEERTESSHISDVKKVRWNEAPESNHDSATTDSAVHEIEDVQSNSLHEKVVLASCCQHYQFACAYYDPVKSTIFVLEDTTESRHFDLLKLLLEQTHPDVALISSRADEGAIEALREFMDGCDGFFQIRPHKDFSPHKGRDRLLSLQLLGELPAGLEQPLEHLTAESTTNGLANAYQFMQRQRQENGDPHMKRWNAAIRLCNYAAIENTPLCLSAIGALLDHLVKLRSLADLDCEGVGGLEIRSIETVALNEVMQINADALSSLQIFDTEGHASIHSDKTKEGLSLFGILNNTRTILGRELLRQWFLRPSLSLEVITSRLDAVECFLQPENLTTADTIKNHLKGLRSTPRILKQLKSGKAGLVEWQSLVKFTFHATMIREMIMELNAAKEIKINQQLLEVLDVTVFRDVGAAVHEIVDWEESAITGRVTVRPHIDEELDNWKHIYNGIDDVLYRVAQQISDLVPEDYATSLNVVYFPQLGFLICLPMRDDWANNQGIQVIDGWTFQFSSESHVYFKSDEMHDMDRHIGDLHPFIVDREIEIIQDLLMKVLVHEGIISRVCDVCAELDCLLCFAEASGAFNYVRPRVTKANVIDIRQGRHPLQEQIVDTFIPNDIVLRGGCGINASLQNEDSDDVSSYENKNINGRSVLVCTGANSCGKSVYLKQTAVIVYMAQIGCFVPAEAATIGMVDKIFTRVETRESVSKVQSAFMIDLNQVSLAMRNCTARSLILLDEFGKGTMSTDGAGLFCGVLSFLSRGSSCPKIIATTHFHDLFHDEILHSSLPIDYAHMQVILTPSEDFQESNVQENQENRSSIDHRADDTITYLYKVVQGLSLHSYAAQCARIFGLSDKLADRAQYISGLLSTHQLSLLLDEKMTDQEEKELEMAEVVCRRFFEWDLSKNEEQDADAKLRLSEVLRSAEEES